MPCFVGAILAANAARAAVLATEIFPFETTAATTTGQSVQPGFVSNGPPQGAAVFGDLNLTVRSRKCLSRLGIATVAELVAKSADELLTVRNFGVTSLNEIRAKLTEVGMALRND